MNLVFQSWGLKGEELGAFLRKYGIYKAELEAWREQMKNGLEDEKAMPRATRQYYREKIKKLEKELEEARAVIEAQKKVQNLLEEEDESTPQKSEKQ